MSKKAYLEQLLGTEQICSEPGLLREFACPAGFEQGICPELAVYPQSSEQVEQLVQWARDTGTPLVPVSSGGRHRSGGSAPSVAGAVMVSMERMKQVLSVDRQFRIAIFEPGITYGELQPILAGQGMRIDMPLAPRAEKSVIASLLGGEPRLNPNMQFNMYEPLRCIEVTWGDGNLMITGEGGGGRSLEGLRKRNLKQIMSNGPDGIDYIRLMVGSQGTSGIASWASVHCALLPETEQFRLVGSEELTPLVELVYRIEHLRFCDMVFILSAVDAAALMRVDPDELPAWLLCLSFADRPPVSGRAQAHLVGVERLAREMGLSLDRQMGTITAQAVAECASTPCAPGEYWKDRPKGNAADLAFITTLNQADGFVQLADRIAREVGWRTEEVGVYIQPTYQGVNCRCEFTVFYGEKEAEKAAAFSERLAGSLSGAGAYYAHPNKKQAALQFAKDPQTLKNLRRIQKIFDPAGIMNPGRLLSAV